MTRMRDIGSRIPLEKEDNKHKEPGNKGFQ